MERILHRSMKNTILIFSICFFLGSIPGRGIYAACYLEAGNICFDGDVSEEDCQSSIGGELLTVDACPNNIFSIAVCEVETRSGQKFSVHYGKGSSKKNMKILCDEQKTIFKAKSRLRFKK
jgi:hypothetical protein